MYPHWALGATRLQHPLHLADWDVLGPLWAIGATIWTTPRSTHFQTIYVPNEPWEPLHINAYTSGRTMHYVSPLSPGSHQASTPFTFSYFGRSRSPVSHRSYYMNHVKIYSFSDILCPEWALGATLYGSPGSHFSLVLLTVQCAMWPHWAPGPPYFIILYM